MADVAHLVDDIAQTAHMILTVMDYRGNNCCKTIDLALKMES